MGEMLSVEQVAEKAGVHIESVRRWIRSGKLPASLPSRYHGYQVAEDDLQAFLNKKNQVKQKGYVEAETVLKSLARENDSISEKTLAKIAYDVAKEAGLLEDLRPKWDSWDGDLVAENAKLLEDRLAYRDRWRDFEKIKETEGRLILAEYKNTT